MSGGLEEVMKGWNPACPSSPCGKFFIGIAEIPPQL